MRGLKGGLLKDGLNIVQSFDGIAPHEGTERGKT